MAVHNPIEGMRGACLLVLNSQLYGLETVIKAKWRDFAVHVCVDGGANTLFDAMDITERSTHIPTYVCGDLDSIRPEVLQFYQQKGSKMVQLPDQNATDFTKTLNYLMEQEIVSENQFSSVYALNALWGRFDQTLGNVSTLYAFASTYDIPIYLLSENSLVFLLQSGFHIIKVDTGFEEGHCGLVPVGLACKSCSTTGLVWNLEHSSMEMGKLTSTCNLLQKGATEVTVETSDPVLWTMSHTLVS
ncbi:hypothetical protein EMCRGX_G025778 [Ephydatia muelleri]|eukprot:Em0021g545a